MNINVFEPGDMSLRYHEARFDGVGTFSIQTPASSGGGGGGGSVDSFTTLPGPLTCGSVYFDGTTNGSILGINATGTMNFGTGNFTVEWWQYQDGLSHSHVRPFNYGTYPSQSFGVSYEGGTFYLWAPGANGIGTLGAYQNQWVHFAITRYNGNVKVFKNGTQIGSTIVNTNYISHSENLTIGNEATPNIDSQFGGYLTNLHMMTACKYGSNFTPDTSKPIPPTNYTVFLMDVDDPGAITKDYVAIHAGYATPGTVYSSVNPFGF